jgi:hypothetical protein
MLMLDVLPIVAARRPICISTMLLCFLETQWPQSPCFLGSD